MKFNELLQRMRDHNHKLNEQYGEILEEDESEMEDLSGSAEWWVEYLSEKHIEANSQVEKSKELSDRYKERMDRFKRRMQYYKVGLQVLLGVMGKDRHVSPTSTVYTHTSTESIEIIDETLVPDEFKKITYEIDKKAVNKYIKDHGDTVWAKKLPDKTSIVVKV